MLRQRDLLLASPLQQQLLPALRVFLVQQHTIQHAVGAKVAKLLTQFAPRG